MAMDKSELGRRIRDLRADLMESRVRVRRYSLDPRLRRPDDPNDKGLGQELRDRADAAFETWKGIFAEYATVCDSRDETKLLALELRWHDLDREIELIQRDLIGNNSFRAGAWTVAWLAVLLVALVVTYLVTHGVRTDERALFEPWALWGPVKYAEVAVWSLFGVICYLLFLASYYLMRRDFDPWYTTWYITTLLRAPFLTVILMMIVLEFAEWYGEGKWIEQYFLEEGNKYYFMIFLSFCLGLASDTTSTIIRDLSEGVGDMVKRAAARVSARLRSAVTDVDRVE